MADVFAGGLAGFETADGELDYEMEEDDFIDPFAPDPEPTSAPVSDEVTSPVEPKMAPEPEAAPVRPAPTRSDPHRRRPFGGGEALTEVLGDVGSAMQRWMEERDADHEAELATLETAMAEKDAEISRLRNELDQAHREALESKTELSAVRDRLRALREVMNLTDAQVPGALSSLERISGRV